MPNFTPEEIVDAIAEVLAAAEGQGIIVTDKRYSQSDGDIARLLKSSADQAEWKGWVIVLLSIPAQVELDDCRMDTTYRFFGKFFHFYEHDYRADLTTDTVFKRAIFAANEALNASRDLGFGNLVRHTGLQSTGDLDTEDIPGGTANEICHGAPFVLDVVVTNSY
jgi:hypothetical protein